VSNAIRHGEPTRVELVIAKKTTTAAAKKTTAAKSTATKAATKTARRGLG
jgi:hypothetical protein